MWVEPLAISLPVAEMCTEEKACLDTYGCSAGKPQTPKGPQSAWGLNQLKEFGDYLGASYARFEDRVMMLLCDIEASTGAPKTIGKGCKSL